MANATRAVRRLVGMLVLGYALVLLFAWVFQARVAFPPRSRALPDPTHYGLADARLAEVRTADGVTLRGWYLPPYPASSRPAPALVWLHDEDETVSSLGATIRELRPPGMAVLVLDYRGSGTSSGRATEAGLYRDAEAAWAYVAQRPEVDRSRIAVYGRGLGTAPALQLGVSRRVRVVVLEAPFTTARALFRRRYWFLPAAVLRLELDNLDRARRLRAPLLVVHGADDRTIPVAMGRAIAEAGRARQLLVVQGAGHDDVYRVAGERYRETVHGFLRATLGS